MSHNVRQCRPNSLLLLTMTRAWTPHRLASSRRYLRHRRHRTRLVAMMR